MAPAGGAAADGCVPPPPSQLFIFVLLCSSAGLYSGHFGVGGQRRTFAPLLFFLFAPMVALSSFPSHGVRYRGEEHLFSVMLFQIPLPCKHFDKEDCFSVSSLSLTYQLLTSCRHYPRLTATPRHTPCKGKECSEHSAPSIPDLLLPTPCHPFLAFVWPTPSRWACAGSLRTVSEIMLGTCPPRLFCTSRSVLWVVGCVPFEADPTPPNFPPCNDCFALRCLFPFFAVLMGFRSRHLNVPVSSPPSHLEKVVVYICRFRVVRGFKK
eukprot:RCo046606